MLHWLSRDASAASDLGTVQSVMVIHEAAAHSNMSGKAATCQAKQQHVRQEICATYTACLKGKMRTRCMVACMLLLPATKLRKHVRPVSASVP